MRLQGETKVMFGLWRMYGSVAATFKNCPRLLTNATESDVQTGSLVLRLPRVVVAGVALLSSNSLRRLSLLTVLHYARIPNSCLESAQCCSMLMAFVRALLKELGFLFLFFFSSSQSCRRHLLLPFSFFFFKIISSILLKDCVSGETGKAQFDCWVLILVIQQLTDDGVKIIKLLVLCHHLNFLRGKNITEKRVLQLYK